MSDLPFISCPTVHTAPNGVTYSCPMCVQSVAAWNHLQSINRAPVKVKPLEWEKTGITSSELKAENYSGLWVVYENNAGSWTLDNGECVCTYASLIEAQSAAQADYERRIKDALKGSSDA
jgi:hypothetical protein